MRNTTWLCAIIFPFLMLLLIGNALVFDTAVYKSLLRPGAVEPTMQLLGYFQGRAEIPGIFDDNEKAHLADVKQVISLLGWISLALLVIFLALMIKADASEVFGKGVLLLLALVFVFAVIPFGTVFTCFHKVFFTGNWMFPEGSMLILLYPESFFQAFFLYIIALTAAFSAVLAVYGYIIQHRKA
jgi:integral membrane protein (TIGR01906 family)